MPQGHHHHENQRDKRNTRLLNIAKRESLSGACLADRPMPLIDIDIDRVAELIKGVTGEREDAFQDTWVALLESKGDIATEDDILNLARQSLNKTILHKYAEASLQQPLNHEPGKPLTIEDVIASPELAIDDPPEPREKKQGYSNGYIRKYGVDREIIAFLQFKYPGEPLAHALRMALGLPQKDDRRWKAAEIELLKSKYPEYGSEACAIELGRSVDSIRNKVCELKLKRMRGRTTPAGAFNMTDIMRIFGISGKYTRFLINKGVLTWRRYKNAKICRRDDLISFIQKHPFLYRHDILEAGWRQYVPKKSLDWITIEQAAHYLNYSHFQLRRKIKLAEIPVKYCVTLNKKTAFVRLEDFNQYQARSEKARELGLLTYEAGKKHYMVPTLENPEEYAYLCHPYDWSTWRHVKKQYKSFDGSIRNTRLNVASATCQKCLRACEITTRDDLKKFHSEDYLFEEELHKDRKIVELYG